MVGDSKRRSKREKPAKPRPDFPLTANGNGQWSKKLAGKVYYFGPWSDPAAALKNYIESKDAILATGRKPQQRGGLTVEDLCDHFLAFKESRKETGELAPRTFDRYFRCCEMLIDHFGRSRHVADLRPEDFAPLRTKMAKRWGPIALGVEIQMVRSVFRYGYDAELIDVPIRFGPAFDKPTAKTLRKTRQAKGPRLFTADQIDALLRHASPNMRAMILLGINGGLGNTDLATMPLSVVDIESGWLDYARSKTAIMRRIPLWPETVDAIKTAIAERREPVDPNEAGLLFIGKRGQSYVGNHKGYRVTQEFDRAAKAAKVEGRAFYDLRRTFQTIGEGANDLAAVGHIMGHSAGSQDMAAIYRQAVSDDRLRAVTDHVMGWLFGSDTARSKNGNR